jgi:hypothetical protein
LLERAETEIGFSMANGTFKMKIDIDRHGPRSMPSNCKNLNPPNFSLPTTFKPAYLELRLAKKYSLDVKLSEVLKPTKKLYKILI